MPFWLKPLSIGGFFFFFCCLVFLLSVAGAAILLRALTWDTSSFATSTIRRSWSSAGAETWESARVGSYFLDFVAPMAQPSSWVRLGWAVTYATAYIIWLADWRIDTHQQSADYS